MAKTLISSGEEKELSPFLRGILTRSLNKASLPFELAYTIATEIRDELDGVEIISSDDLREMVTIKLKGRVKNSIIQRYQVTVPIQHTIHVKKLDGQLAPYSNQRLGRELELIGLSQRKIHTAVLSINKLLIDSGITEIHVNQLGNSMYTYLLEDPLFGKKVAQKYLKWVNFTRSGLPLILLIGGTSGSGKSTIATGLANRLGIVRTQSTDMLREVMRMMIPKKLLPVLHESSFNAGKVLPSDNLKTSDNSNNMLIVGYRTQTELLGVSCEAVIKRSLKEKVSLLLEGVHVNSTLVPKIPKDNAVVIHIMLAIMQQKELRKRLKGRHVDVPERQPEPLSNHFKPIWQLQNLLLDEADREDVAIIENRNKEETMREIMKFVLKQISDRFSASLEDVFCDEKPIDRLIKNQPEK
ncbi:MAG: hypothetical protein GY808_11845 [Gammaproteobacteria bacterium]|nr:hypothetical protein [Gammaproteobacteria bacterium]